MRCILIGEAGFRFLEFMSRSCHGDQGGRAFPLLLRPWTFSTGGLADGDSLLRLIGLSRWSTLKDTIAYSLLIRDCVKRCGDDR